MTRALIATLALALTADAAQDPVFVEDEWEAWNSSAVGSSVTFEIELAGRDVKTKRTVTLKSKGADSLVLVSQEEGGEPEEETVEKPTEKPKPPDSNPKCTLCGKHAGAETRQTKEKLKIAGKEYECVRVDQKTIDCKGNTPFRESTWFSKEVPGWKVRVDTEIAGMKSTVACTAFTKK